MMFGMALEDRNYDEAIRKMGGSLKILDSWDLTIKNDSQGKKTISLVLRKEKGKEMKLDIDAKIISDLAEEGRVLLDAEKKLPDETGLMT